ncbi:MAG: protein-glutamine glutaminase family protein [Bacteroidota bacterium]
MNTIIPALLDLALSDINTPYNIVSKNQAEQLFIFFKQHILFNWKNANNGCEGRADAACVLLDKWGIPNYKGWVFSGAFLKKHVGELKNGWKYHVAPVLLVKEDGQIIQYVLDPSTADSLQPIEEWAASITQLPHSYYFTRLAHWYVFPHKNISSSKWNSRNRQNRKWMIQCLAGINGLTTTGKAKLIFNKVLIKNTLSAFEQMKKEKPIA